MWAKNKKCRQVPIAAVLPKAWLRISLCTCRRGKGTRIIFSLQQSGKNLKFPLPLPPHSTTKLFTNQDFYESLPIKVHTARARRCVPPAPIPAALPSPGVRCVRETPAPGRSPPVPPANLNKSMFFQESSHQLQCVVPSKFPAGCDRRDNAVADFPTVIQKVNGSAQAPSELGTHAAPQSL